MSHNTLPPIRSLTQNQPVRLLPGPQPLLRLGRTISITTKDHLLAILRPDVLPNPILIPILDADVVHAYVQMKEPYNFGPTKDQTGVPLEDRILAFYQAARVREMLVLEIHKLWPEIENYPYIPVKFWKSVFDKKVNGLHGQRKYLTNYYVNWMKQLKVSNPRALEAVMARTEALDERWRTDAGLFFDPPQINLDTEVTAIGD
ncbi:Fc.00g079830.m01.CDS01 [Cosmosporella sp. VM-42]